MRGYINHDLEIKKLTEIAKKNKLDVNKDVLDDPKRLEHVGVPGLTMRMLAEDPVIDIYSRVVNYFKSDWAKFFNLFSNCYQDIVGSQPSINMLDGSPIITLHPKMPDKVYVYPTLVHDKYTQDPFYWGRPRLVSSNASFIRSYFEDKKDGKKKLAWSPLARAKSRILRRELVDISRVLTRFMPELAKNATSSQIRDIATAMVEYNMPMELSYADTDPSDFYNMYVGGPDSCMKDNGSRPFSWMAKLAKPIHPTSIFAYSPYVKGVYFKKAGKVVARTFLYDGTFFGSSNHKGKWYYGRVYGSTTKYANLFTTALNTAGYFATDNSGVPLNKTYTIEFVPIEVSPEEAPNVGIAAGSYVYVPYLDNHARDCNVVYDEDTNKVSVTFAPADGSSNCSMGSQHGYLPVQSFKNSYCHSCGGVIKAGANNKAIYTTDGKAFHDSSCAIVAGYVSVIVGADGATAMMHKDSPTIVKDIYTGKYFSPSGASSHGVLPMLTSMYEDLEDIFLFTSSGHVVRLDGTYYRISSRLADQLPKGSFSIKSDTKYGEVWVINKDVMSSSYMDVKTVRTVILEEDHTHIQAKTLRQIEQVAA